MCANTTDMIEGNVQGCAYTASYSRKRRCYVFISQGVEIQVAGSGLFFCMP